MTKIQMASRLMSMAHSPEFTDDHHDFLEEASYALQNYDRDLQILEWKYSASDRHSFSMDLLYFVAGLLVGAFV